MVPEGSVVVDPALCLFRSEQAPVPPLSAALLRLGRSLSIDLLISRQPGSASNGGAWKPKTLYVVVMRGKLGNLSSGFEGTLDISFVCKWKERHGYSMKGYISGLCPWDA